MVFQEWDYSHFVDNGGLREVNEVAWEWIPESNYTIKLVEVHGDTLLSYKLVNIKV